MIYKEAFMLKHLKGICQELAQELDHRKVITLEYYVRANEHTNLVCLKEATNQKLIDAAN